MKTKMVSLVCLLTFLSVNALVAERAPGLSTASPFESLSTPAGCGSEAEGLLALFMPAWQMTGFTDTCGACSPDAICRGAHRGQVCGINAYCIPPATQMCPGTVDWNCRCRQLYHPNDPPGGGYE